MATLGLSKVFILDKYFTELQKYWETEKKLQGKCQMVDGSHIYRSMKQFDFISFSVQSFLMVLSNRRTTRGS